MGRNLPRVVTLVSRVHFGVGLVLRLESEGPRFYGGTALYLEDGVERPTCTSKWERKDYHLLEGRHRDLLQRMREAETDFRSRLEEFHHTRERAVWELRDQWDREHPSPVAPKVEEFLGGIQEEEQFCDLFETKRPHVR
jgi:hypothetical protein